METEHVETAASYRALYRIRPIIYQIGDMKLWMPIQRDGIVLWFIYLVVFFVLYFVFPILTWVLPFDPLIGMVVGPIVLAYWSVKLDPAGKTVPAFLWELVCFMMRPKWFVNWEACRFHPIQGRCRFTGQWRNTHRQLLEASGLEQVEVAEEAICVGQVKGLRFFSLPRSGEIRWREKSGRLLIQLGKQRQNEQLAAGRVPILNQTVRFSIVEPTEVLVEKAGKDKYWRVVTKGGMPM